jgi:hypothetical protein
MTLLLMPAQTRHRLRPQLGKKMLGKLAKGLLAPADRCTHEGLIQDSLFQHSRAAPPKSPGEELGREPAGIGQQAKRAPQQQ